MKRTTTSRIAAFAIATVLSTLTLAFAMPGGTAYVAGRILPDAGNAFEAIASTGATEVAIEPGRIDVVGVRTTAQATNAPRG
jgi:ABC-type sugar transport system substrate-binding protein